MAGYTGVAGSELLPILGIKLENGVRARGLKVGLVVVLQVPS